MTHAFVHLAHGEVGQRDRGEPARRRSWPPAAWAYAAARSRPRRARRALPVPSPRLARGAVAPGSWRSSSTGPTSSCGRLALDGHPRAGPRSRRSRGHLLARSRSGVVLGRVVLGVDVRTVGSGNIGATNVARAGGKKMGIAVLLLDALKAIVPIVVARRLLAGRAERRPVDRGRRLAAFVGHLYPLAPGFKGGRGSPPGSASSSCSRPGAALAGVVDLAGRLRRRPALSLRLLLGTVVVWLGTFWSTAWRARLAWSGSRRRADSSAPSREHPADRAREEKRMRV